MWSLPATAYFEVAKDAARPFRVKAKDMRLEVLGTSFNVMAYRDERTVNTSLLEGAVKVSGSAGAATLKPGQQARMSSDALKVAAADMDEAVAWKERLVPVQQRALRNRHAPDIKVVRRGCGICRQNTGRPLLRPRKQEERHSRRCCAYLKAEM